MFPTVLVMLGLDHKDDAILDALVAGASKLGVVRVLVAHIHNRDPIPAPLVGLVSMEEPPRPAGLDAAVASLSERLPGVSVDGMHRSGPPEYVLASLTEEFDVDLFVMGRDKAEGGSAGWGSASRKIVRQTTCSALVVPVGSTLDLSRVVVGFDFSQYSNMALAVACQIADSALAVYQYDDKVPAAGGLKQAPFKSQIEQAFRDHLQREVMPWLGKSCGGPELVAHGGGRVAEALLGHAGDSPIIMGSRGLTPLAALLLGSSADRVAGRATGPVLIVRKKGSVLGLFERLVHKN
jgi:nucleotide-binding universal stress UspA family protein